MGEQHEVNAGSVEPERSRVRFALSSALIETAVDRNAPPGAFDEVAGTGDLTIGTVKGQLHGSPPT